MLTLGAEAGDQTSCICPWTFSEVRAETASVKPCSNPERQEEGGLEQCPCRDQPQLWALLWVPPTKTPAALHHGQHQPEATSQAGATGEDAAVLPKITMAQSPSHHPRGVQESFACPLKLLSSPLTHGCQWDVHHGFPTMSIPCQPLGPFDPEMKPRLISSCLTSPGPTSRKTLCPGSLQPESDHLPRSQVCDEAPVKISPQCTSTELLLPTAVLPLRQLEHHLSQQLSPQPRQNRWVAASWLTLNTRMWATKTRPGSLGAGSWLWWSLISWGTQ